MKSLGAIVLLIFSLPLMAEECHQKIIKDSISVEWTGYKTTDKVGVTGKFEEIGLMSSGKGPRVQDIVKAIQFSIDGLEFDAGNWVRNRNLKKHFFKKFTDSAKITGSVKDMPDSVSGELKLDLKVNGVSNSIPMQYKIANDSFEATGSMKMSDFKLQGALASISKACYKLHTGADGVSKTWATVDLKTSAKFEKVCK